MSLLYKLNFCDHFELFNPIFLNLHNKKQVITRPCASHIFNITTTQFSGKACEISFGLAM